MPYEQPDKQEEEGEISEEVLKDVVSNIFFRAHAPQTLKELSSRIKEQAEQLSLSKAVLEKEIMLYMADEMANSVD